MKRVLLTGFDPFGGETVNPSWEAVNQLRHGKLSGIEVVTKELPTVFEKSVRLLRQWVLELKPDVVIGIGQAGGRSDIAIERLAVNLDDARIPDNEGNQPLDKPIIAGGPSAYWSTLPVKGIEAAVREAGIPASISYSAGTFVCNHLFYSLQHMLASSHYQVRGGFIHIPYLPAQVAERPGVPSMSLELVVKAIEIAIQTSTSMDD